jgi:hypothetical protein
MHNDDRQRLRAGPLPVAVAEHWNARRHLNQRSGTGRLNAAAGGNCRLSACVTASSQRRGEGLVPGDCEVRN